MYYNILLEIWTDLPHDSPLEVVEATLTTSFSHNLYILQYLTELEHHPTIT